MQSFAFCAAAIVYALWLLGTLSIQKGIRDWTFIKQYDVFHILPEWNFFAPNPGIHDYHILYRDVLLTGEFTRWVEVNPVEWRPWYTCFWNPGRRYRKAILDLCTHFGMVLENADQKPSDDRIKLSIPYLTLLILISNIQRNYDFRYFQFIIMITRYSSTSDPKQQVALVSGLHNAGGA